VKVSPSALRASNRSSPAARACEMTFRIASPAVPNAPAICIVSAISRQARASSACAPSFSSSGMISVLSCIVASDQLPASACPAHVHSHQVGRRADEHVAGGLGERMRPVDSAFASSNLPSSTKTSASASSAAGEVDRLR
jgi:hypothetical protein